jgi:hypothetical protein
MTGGVTETGSQVIRYAEKERLISWLNHVSEDLV